MSSNSQKKNEKKEADSKPEVSTSAAASSVPKSVIVHPLVLLSVVDHFNRVAKGTNRRVVGALQGTVRNGVVDITNSFAVPFEEDANDPSIWYFDHDFVDNMFEMTKKINAKERVVGWYHSGPKLKSNDLLIDGVLRKFHPNPVLVIIEVQPKELGLPTDAYIAVEEVHDDGTPTSKTFEHIPCEVGASETEEVGVEHLLRDVKDTRVGTLSERVTKQLTGLRGLLSRLGDVQQYLDKVVEGKLPSNNQIMSQLQDVLNLLPNVSVEELVNALSVQTNDQMLVVYVSSLVRAIIALHNLINNKISNRDLERKTEQAIARSLEDTMTTSSGKTKDGPVAKA